MEASSLERIGANLMSLGYLFWGCCKGAQCLLWVPPLHDLYTAMQTFMMFLELRRYWCGAPYYPNMYTCVVVLDLECSSGDHILKPDCLLVALTETDRSMRSGGRLGRNRPTRSCLWMLYFVFYPTLFLLLFPGHCEWSSFPSAYVLRHNSLPQHEQRNETPSGLAIASEIISWSAFSPFKQFFLSISSHWHNID